MHWLCFTGQWASTICLGINLGAKNRKWGKACVQGGAGIIAGEHCVVGNDLRRWSLWFSTHDNNTRCSGGLEYSCENIAQTPCTCTVYLTVSLSKILFSVCVLTNRQFFTLACFVMRCDLISIHTSQFFCDFIQHWHTSSPIYHTINS